MSDDTAKVIQELNSLFGTDDDIGVYFEYEHDSTRMTPSQVDKLYEKLGDDMPGTISYLPHGGSAVCCTDYAIHVYLRFPERTKIVGFANVDNPESRVAKEEIHPEGHDFAIVDDRFLVDPWIKLVACETQQVVFDLANPMDQAVVLDFYGPRDLWVHMDDTEEYCRKELGQYFYRAPEESMAPSNTRAKARYG